MLGFILELGYNGYMISIPKCILYAWLVGTSILILGFIGMSAALLYTVNQGPSSLKVKQAEFSNQAVYGSDISAIQNMVALINETRAADALPPLKESPVLNATALEKACDMVEREYFGHVDPDGREVWHIFDAKGYVYAHAGENLIEGYKTDLEAMEAIMESERHRANVLSNQFTEVGIGRCGSMVVQHFGSIRY